MNASSPAHAYRPPDPGFAPTVPNLIAHAASQFAEQPFLVDDERSISFAEADALSAQMARGLLALGHGKASRVGLLGGNTPDWVLSFLAASRIGALIQLFSTLYKPAELAWGLDHLDVETLVVQASYAGADYVTRLEQAIPALAQQTGTTLFLPSHPYLRRIIVLGDCDIVLGDCDRPWAIGGLAALEQLARDNPHIDRAHLELIEQRVVPADLLVTISTSGTSAHPKAVVHSHGTAVRISHEFLNYIDMRHDDRNLCAMPFFWVGGLNENLLPAMHDGVTLVFAPGPRVADFLHAIDRHKVTRMPYWPIQRKELVRLADERGVDVSAVRRLRDSRDDQGNIIPSERQAHGFGMTECFGMHSVEKYHVPIPEGKAGSFSRNLAGIERRIVDHATGLPLPSGQKGELQVRGYTLMSGYYKVEHDDTFLANGYFDTGDECSLDADGFLYFHARNSDMIKTSGANVSPLEVERVLAAMPGVDQVHVVGVPHPDKGEAVVAAVVALPDAPLDLAALRDAASKELSAYKLPLAMILFDLGNLPRTGSAKVSKVQLAQVLAKQVDW